MKAQEIVLDQKIQLLKDSGVLQTSLVSDPSPLHPLIGSSRFGLTLHHVPAKTCLYINDTMRDYYGYDSNDMRDRHITFYLKTVAPLDMHTLLVSAQFFGSDNRGYLNASHQLKAADGSYAAFPTCSRTCTWDEKGRPQFALSISTKEEDLPLLAAHARHDLSGLSERDLLCLKDLLRGQSNCQIADAIDLSEKSVEGIIRRVLMATRHKSRYSLIQECTELL